ncbi:MAG: acyltransferase [Micavibrio sp.]|nr:acyltransferase [Micavibrio sp.]
MKYVPALDGMRAIAVLLVIVFHATTGLATQGGYIGVDIFFVLSGFLITTILMDEQEETGGIRLRDFYLRRFFRLMPAVLLMLAGYFITWPFFWDLTLAEVMRNMTLVGFYLADYSVAFWYVPEELSHSWSLSVEEHYYILWPLILIGLSRLPLKRRMIIMLAFYLLVTVWRDYNAFIVSYWRVAYNRFDTHCSGLILGGLLAFFMKTKRVIPYANFILPALLLPLAYLMTRLPWGKRESMLVLITLTEVATFFAIYVCLTQSGKIFVRGLSSQPLKYLGKISYGLYLYHFPIIFYLRAHYSTQVTLVDGMILTLIIAAASFHLVERPIVNWARQRFHRHTLKMAEEKTL